MSGAIKAVKKVAGSAVNLVTGGADQAKAIRDAARREAEATERASQEQAELIRNQAYQSQLQQEAMMRNQQAQAEAQANEQAATAMPDAVEVGTPTGETSDRATQRRKYQGNTGTSVLGGSGLRL